MSALRDSFAPEISKLQLEYLNNILLEHLSIINIKVMISINHFITYQSFISSTVYYL